MNLYAKGGDIDQYTMSRLEDVKYFIKLVSLFKNQQKESLLKSSYQIFQTICE